MKGGIDLKIGLHIPKVHDMTTDTVDVISTSAVTADAVTGSLEPDGNDPVQVLSNAGR